MPAIAHDPELKARLTRVYVDCQENFTETGRRLALDKATVRRLLMQEYGPTAKTRARVEPALSAYERERRLKRNLNATQTHLDDVPGIAREVIRYVLEAIEARRDGAHSRE